MTHSNDLSVNLSFLMTKPTGITTYSANLLPYLQALDPTLLVSKTLIEAAYYQDRIGDSRQFFIPAGMTPEQGTRGHFSRLIWTQFQLSKIYRQLKSQLLFSPIPEAPLFSQCRYVVTVHDLIPLRFPKRFSPLTPYFYYYIPQVLTQAQHILCNSVATAEDIVQFFKIPARKITPILLAHDATNFRFLDLPTSNYFLYLGRCDPHKNVSRLITAFATLPKHLDCELWIAGPSDPRYHPVLMAQAEELGVRQQLKFLDYVPYSELPVVINRAIALVFPSLWEGFGFPVLEAMACGTPVITSNLSSLPEVTGDAALLVDPYNPTAIATAMTTVVSDTTTRQQLRDCGLQRANQFSWAKTGLATVEVLRQFL